MLFLQPGCGKTTIVREVIKTLATKKNVVVIDTSNEISGNGDIPHSCIGMARKLMVPSLDKQSSIMVECVQNHTPDVMVIDEIGRQTEVKAAATSKNRGVRIVASAHGNLRSLMKNGELIGLIGGLQTSTLGDGMALQEAKKKGLSEIRKNKVERASSPIFDIIIELTKGKHHEWDIVLNAAKAVDDILNEGKYEVQRRIRDPSTGEIVVEYCYN